MKRILAAIDFFAFLLLGAFFLAALLSVFFTTSIFFGKKRRKPGAVNKFTFPVYDLISDKYDSMFEEALLGDFIYKDYYIYLDFNNPDDRYEEIGGRIFFWSVAAHPDNRIYRAGFRKINMILTEINILVKSFKIIWGSGISAIKAHDPHLLGLNGLVLSRLFRVPFIIHLNSDFDMKYLGTGRVASPMLISRGVERLLESFTIDRADIVMADRKFYSNSKSLPKRSLSRYRAVGVRVDQTHYTDPVLRRDMKEALGAEGRKVLLYVGRLHPVKYPEDAIKAFKTVKANIGNAVLWIVGSGVLKEHLQGMAISMGLKDSVFFLGSKKNHDLINIFSTADVLLAPHGGLTLVESALASTPIVAYDFDWHSEFLEDGKMGYLVPFRDSEEMARRAVNILSDEGLHARMSDYCRTVALERCSRYRSVENERKVYEELLRV
jgi:glycosyltransferase involved in cell wall biosynthesis